MNTQAQDIEAYMPLVRRKARALCRKVPASVELDDLVQAGRIAVWQAIESFDGRGVLGAHVAQRVGYALIDYLRETHPVGRDGPQVHFVSEDELVFLAASDPTPSEAAEAKNTFDAAMRAMTKRGRTVAKQTLDGVPGMKIASVLGVTPGRVCQIKAEAAASAQRQRTPPTFDPTAVPLHVGKPVPPVWRERRSKYRELVELTPATGSRVLGIVQARSFIAELKRAGLPHVYRQVSATTVEVWREPSEAQMRGMLCGRK